MFYDGITIFELPEFILFAGLFIGFAAYESIVAPILVLLAFFVVGYFINHFDFLSVYYWIVDNQFKTFMAIVAYIVAGILWSLLKWKLVLRDVKNAIIARLNHDENASLSYLTVKGMSVNAPVSASDFKERLTALTIHWWISIPVTVLGDWFVRFWNGIYNLISNLYQKMADSEMSDINAKIKNRQRP